jgi:hypothetical protein
MVPIRHLVCNRIYTSGAMACLRCHDNADGAWALCFLGTNKNAADGRRRICSIPRSLQFAAEAIRLGGAN